MEPVHNKAIVRQIYYRRQNGVKKRSFGFIWKNLHYQNFWNNHESCALLKTYVYKVVGYNSYGGKLVDIKEILYIDQLRSVHDRETLTPRKRPLLENAHTRNLS